MPADEDDYRWFSSAVPKWKGTGSRRSMFDDLEKQVSGWLLIRRVVLIGTEGSKLGSILSSISDHTRARSSPVTEMGQGWPKKEMTICSCIVVLARQMQDQPYEW